MNIKLIAGILLFLIASLILNAVLFSSNNKNKRQVRTLTETVMASQDTLRNWKDAHGKLYSEKEVLIANYNKLKETNDKLISTVEKQRKELQIKPKDVQYVNVETIKIDTVLKTIMVDSCYAYEDIWNSFEFCKDLLTIRMQDTTNAILYTQKYIINPSKIFFIRWFQKKSVKYNLNITHTNPLLFTTDLKTIINSNKKWKP